MSDKQTQVQLAALRQKGLCYYCWSPLGSDCTAEHLVAKAHGGKLSPANTRAAHAGCNNEADSLPLEVKTAASLAGRTGGKAAFQSVISKAKNKRRRQRAAEERARMERKAARRAWAAVNAARSRSNGSEKKS